MTLTNPAVVNTLADVYVRIAMLEQLFLRKAGIISNSLIWLAHQNNSVGYFLLVMMRRCKAMDYYTRVIDLPLMRLQPRTSLSPLSSSRLVLQMFDRHHFSPPFPAGNLHLRVDSALLAP